MNNRSDTVDPPSIYEFLRKRPKLSPLNPVCLDPYSRRGSLMVVLWYGEEFSGRLRIFYIPGFPNLVRDYTSVECTIFGRMSGLNSILVQRDYL